MFVSQLLKVVDPVYNLVKASSLNVSDIVPASPNKCDRSLDRESR